LITLKSPREIDLMRQAGRIVAEVLAILTEKAVPGVTTQELDRIAEEHIRAYGAIPAFKGYDGGNSKPPFPGSICASVNQEVVHGIPGSRVLEEGDILSVDVGAEREGYFGDAARTIAVGRISPDAARLVKVCREALDTAIREVRAGARLSDLSAAVQRYVEGNGYSVVRKFVGHGIGAKMHEEPQIPNYVSASFPDVVLKAGMTLAIEPMINQGTHRVRTAPDQWTVTTADGMLSAHWEHTVVVRQEGAEILTVP
jgi:methionyl aminopeptidase